MSTRWPPELLVMKTVVLGGLPLKKTVQEIVVFYLVACCQ